MKVVHLTCILLIVSNLLPSHFHLSLLNPEYNSLAVSYFLFSISTHHHVLFQFLVLEFQGFCVCFIRLLSADTTLTFIILFVHTKDRIRMLMKIY